MNIHMFWSGDNPPENFIKTQKLCKQLKYNFITNTTQDHKELLDKYLFYRKAFNESKYAFMSDVWRVYSTQKHKGIYIDANAEITKASLARLVNEYERMNGVGLLADGKKSIWNGFFMVKSDHDILSDLLKVYEKYDNTFITGPTLVTLVANKYGRQTWDTFTDSNIKLYATTYGASVEKGFFKNNSLGSWTNGEPFDIVKCASLFEQRKMSRNDKVAWSILSKNLMYWIMFFMYLIVPTTRRYKKEVRQCKKIIKK